MNFNTYTWMKKLAVTMAVVCHAAVAHATLGGNIDSVEANRVHMNAANPAHLTQSSTGSYMVHETTLPTGTIVRQYVSAAGVVFAVTWNGPFKPDLHQLLGQYFDTMIARQAGQPMVGHRLILQHGSDLVVESGGHQRSFVGRAYLPNQLPAGVSENDIH